LKMKIAAAAILMCAVMVLVAGAPLVVADTHHVAKGAQGPRASAVSWEYAPTEAGVWTGHVVNSGLRSLVVDVDDITTGAASSNLHQRIRFAVAGDDMMTSGAMMAKNHLYNITVTPNGPRGTYCDVIDVFVIPTLPVAMFTVSVSGATVNVDGSDSYDLNPGQSIQAWGWEWGDGSPSSTGMTASHTYTVSKTYTITLTVWSTTGLTGSTSHDAVVDTPPVAAFTAIPNAFVVSLDASASTDNQPIVTYAWDFGDAMTGTGKITTHAYATPGLKTITLTVTDTVGQTNSVSHDVTVAGNAPVASFTATVRANGYTVAVNGMNSTGTGALTYSWNWGDMITQAGMTATHTYLSNGLYTITLTVKDTLGLTGSTSQIVSISNTPIPPTAFIIYGTTWASGGVTPLGGCTISITDVTIGTTLIGTVSLSDGTYAGDISGLFPSAGDTVVVSAIGPAGQTGTGTGVLVGTPYLGINVTLT